MKIFKELTVAFVSLILLITIGTMSANAKSTSPYRQFINQTRRIHKRQIRVGRYRIETFVLNGDHYRFSHGRIKVNNQLVSNREALIRLVRDRIDVRNQKTRVHRNSSNHRKINLNLKRHSRRRLPRNLKDKSKNNNRSRIRKTRTINRNRTTSPKSKRAVNRILRTTTPKRSKAKRKLVQTGEVNNTKFINLLGLSATLAAFGIELIRFRPSD